MRESVARFGSASQLQGVLTAVDDGARARLGVVFLNAGVVHHVGPNRLWVDLARECVGADTAALRMDFSGIGDSAPRTDTVRFERAAVAETREALDFMHQATGAEAFVLVGLCSGAEISFKTAHADPRVVAAVMINAPRFLEEPSPTTVRAVEERQAAAYTWRVSLFSWGSWARLLTGRADYRGLMRALRSRMGRSTTRGGSNPDARAFADLVERGVLLRLVIADGDWALGYLRTVLGSSLDAMVGSGAATLDVVPACDHLMTPRAAREQTRRAVLATLAAAVDRQSRRPRQPDSAL